MCLEHLDHWLQQRHVRRQKDELDVAMQVLQHLGVSRSVVEDHQDTEREVLRHAILLELVHQLNLAAFLKNVTSHPTSEIGEPLDRQAALIKPLECTRVLRVVDQDGLELSLLSG